LSDPFVAEVLTGTTFFGIAQVQPLLTFDLIEGPQPVKTIPAHFSSVADASPAEIEAVFGQEDQRHFAIGSPIEMEAKLCLDLQRLAERSVGVFGKTGTGKTTLTRLLLLALVAKGQAISLVFDMDGEYGWKGHWEGGPEVKGLRPLLGARRVAIFTLDAQATLRKGDSYDAEVQIGYDQIEPEDVLLLGETLSLTSAQVEAIHRLGRHYGPSRWFSVFLGSSSADWEELEGLGLRYDTLSALQRKLETRLARLPFLKLQAPSDPAEQILQYLQSGRSVVLEFGNCRSPEAYVLVANFLTRRIHDAYVEQTDRWMAGMGEQPRHLVIAIEEAHRFLNPEIASQTPFGAIAREMRKYQVTLLVVDQRPSGLDEEVMSQLGTRITGLLDDEKDIAAVLSGLAGAGNLRGVLARLDSRRQALILGHAVPMPAVFEVREYGTEESYRELGFAAASALSGGDDQDLFS
ncbi:MAG: ATP-binding protein, partial [Chloroflexi bacterium]|nr:ATP-binding protein [Chloroflexota bacterium]